MADRKLFIGNLVRRITQEDLWVMYSTFGPLEECAKFHESFGFVRFQHAEDARQALKATHGITLKGRCIKVEFAATTTSWKSISSSCCTQCRPPGRTKPILARNILFKFSRNQFDTTFRRFELLIPLLNEDNILLVFIHHCQHRLLQLDTVEKSPQNPV